MPALISPSRDRSRGGERASRVFGRWPGPVDIGDQQEAVLLLLDLPAEAHERFGAPGQLSIEIVFPRAEPRVDFAVQWFDKPASRLPEAAWFSFVLPDHGPRWRRSWRMDKLGESVSPLDVVRNGNRRLHAVGSGLCADDGQHAVSVETLDARSSRPDGRASSAENRRPGLRDGLRSRPPQQPLGHRFPPVVRGRRAVSLQSPADDDQASAGTRARPIACPGRGDMASWARRRPPGLRHRSRRRRPFEAARAVIPGGVTSSVRAGARPHPLYLDRGQGPYVWDVDGNQYVDYALGYGPLILGHAPIVVRDAIAPQLDRGLTFGSQHRLEPQLAELLVQTVPGADQAIFATTGRRGRRRGHPPGAGRDQSRPRHQIRGPLSRLARGVFASTGFDPGSPARRIPRRSPRPWDPARHVGRRRRRPMERHRLGRADPRRAPVGRGRDPMRARRGQRRPDRGPGRVPRGAPPGATRSGPYSCSTRSSPGSRVARGAGADGRVPTSRSPRRSRVGSR